MWNMSEPIVLVLKRFIVEEMERVQLNNQTNDVPLDIEEIDEEDFKFIIGFYNLFQLFLHFVDMLLRSLGLFLHRK